MHEVYCEVNVCYKWGFKWDFMRFIVKSNASPILLNGDSSLLFLVRAWLRHFFFFSPFDWTLMGEEPMDVWTVVSLNSTNFAIDAINLCK